MESINISNMPPQRVMVKEAFTRLVPSASLTPIGEAKSISSAGPLSYSYENTARQPMSQADFMREYDVNAHRINSLKYYPNALLKDTNGKVAAKIRPRIAVAWQKRILVKRLATLTGNNVNIRLSNSKRTAKDQQMLNDFREGWENKNMQNLIYQSLRSDGIVGDVAACL